MDSRVSVLIDIRSKLAGLNQASAGFGRLIKSVAGFTAAYLSMRSVIGNAREVLKLGADLDHLSSRTGISVSNLKTLQQAFEDNGVSAESVGRTFNDMQKKLSEAAQGTGEGRMALEQLGVRIEDIINLAPEKQFEVLTEKIAALENPANRASVAMRLFGESGATLMPLFRNGGAIDDARRSLGQMPELLQRNSAEFERIDTLLGRLPNKSRQLFVGLGDMLADELTAPLEALNQIDLSGLGQRIGAFIDLAIDAFRDGSLAEFIGLTIEAGFEQGSIAARRALDETLSWLSADGQGWKVVLNGVMTFGTQAAEALIDALDTPIAWLSAGFRKVGDEARVIFQQAGNFLAQSFSAVLNTITAGFEALLNGVIERVNSITAALPFTDGTNISQVQFGRVDWGNTVIQPAREFNDLLKEQQEGLDALSQLIKDNLNQNLEESRHLIGLEADETERVLSATKRLNELIQQRIENRELQALESGPGTDPDSGQDSGFASALTAAGKSATDTFNSVDSALRSGLSSSFQGLINQTHTWRDAVLNLSGTIGGSLVQSFSKMAANWIADRIRMFVLGESLKQAETTSTLAQEAVKQTAMTPTALLASIGSFGAAALIGAAVLTAVLASVGGFAEGGYTGAGGRLEPAGIVHRGEYVIPADIVSRHGPEAIDALVGNLRVGRSSSALEGFVSGGLVEPVAASAITTATETGTGEPASQIFVVPDLASAEDLAADLTGKVDIRIQNSIRRYRA